MSIYKDIFVHFVFNKFESEIESSNIEMVCTI